MIIKAPAGRLVAVVIDREYVGIPPVRDDPPLVIVAVRVPDVHKGVTDIPLNVSVVN
jgi:hypothetical protein